MCDKHHCRNKGVIGGLRQCPNCHKFITPGEIHFCSSLRDRLRSIFERGVILCDDEIHPPKRETPADPIGWKCPRCQTIHAPHIARCDCSADRLHLDKPSVCESIGEDGSGVERDS